MKPSNRLSEVPCEILNLYNRFEILDLSNAFCQSPSCQSLDDIIRLHKLKISFFSACNFATFPAQQVQCRSLEMIAFKNNRMGIIPTDSFPRKSYWLILIRNLCCLPVRIGQCCHIQKCLLAGNRLTSLLDEMQHCRKLGFLRLSYNKLTSLPPGYLSFLRCPSSPLRGKSVCLSPCRKPHTGLCHLVISFCTGSIRRRSIRYHLQRGL